METNLQAGVALFSFWLEIQEIQEGEGLLVIVAQGSIFKRIH